MERSEEEEKVPNGCAQDGIMNCSTDNERQDSVGYDPVGRFLAPHRLTYDQALSEVRNGKKESHWMWWVFPQMRGLGKSERSQFYGIRDRNEAHLFLSHPLLGKHLREITQAVLASDNTPYGIFGNDVIKFRSCMLLFASLEQEASQNIFKKVLEIYNWN